MSCVLIFGDINVDLLARLPAPLATGTDNLFPAFELQLGGVGANAAVLLCKLGVEARVMSCVARDWLGDFAMQALESQSVNVSCITRVDGVTGLVVIPIDPGGQRTILGSRGANERAPSADIATSLRGVDAVHVFGYMLLSEPTRRIVRDLIRRARTAGILVSFDAGPGPSRQAREEILALAPELDVLFVSLEDAEALTGRSGAEAIEAIARCGAREIVLKRGEAGCQFRQGGRWWMVPPLAVEVVDTTGAGDAFAAGFLYAELRGWSSTDAALLANAMGAAAAAVLGAGAAMPGLAEVTRVLERDPADTSAHLLKLLRAEKSSAKVG